MKFKAKFFVLMIVVLATEALSGLVDAQSVSGHITGVYWPSGTSSGGYSDTPQITIKNTGSEGHEFWIQVEVQDPNGDWYEEAFMHTATIAPGKDDMSMPRITIDTSNSSVLPNAKGYYSGRVTLYDGFEKHNRLDSQIQHNVIKAT